MRKTLVKVGAGAALVLLALAGPSFAGSTTGSVGVSGSVSNNCVISNAPSIGFGSYDPIVTNASASLDQTGMLQLTCTQGAVAVVALDAGANSSHATGTTRAMSNGSGKYLSYEIYSDSGRSTVWGTGGSAVTEPAAPSDAAVNYTMYGRVPSGQDVPAASYSDTVGITVNF